MFPKRNRLDKKTIERIFKEGKFINSPSFLFKFILDNNSLESRISFIVPKNIAKLAVARNLLRRKGYSVFKNYINQFPSGILGIFVFRRPEKDISKIKHEIKNILNKIG